MVICCSLVKYGRFSCKLSLVRATFRAEGFSTRGRFFRAEDGLQAPSHKLMKHKSPLVNDKVYSLASRLPPCKGFNLL